MMVIIACISSKEACQENIPEKIQEERGYRETILENILERQKDLREKIGFEKLIGSTI